MHDQLSLLLREPDPAEEAQRLARRMDPTTSHDAADRAVESGTVRGQKRKILEDLKLHPGSTACEIEDRTGVRAHRRMSALEESGHVTRGPRRTCLQTGYHAHTWEVRP